MYVEHKKNVELLCCTSETNIMLNVNYNLKIKLIKKELTSVLLDQSTDYRQGNKNMHNISWLVWLSGIEHWTAKQRVASSTTSQVMCLGYRPGPR